MITVTVSKPFMRTMKFPTAETFSMTGQELSLWANEGETFLGMITVAEDDREVEIQCSFMPLEPSFEDTLRQQQPARSYPDGQNELDVTQYQPGVGDLGQPPSPHPREKEPSR